MCFEFRFYIASRYCNGSIWRRIFSVEVIILSNYLTHVMPLLTLSTPSSKYQKTRGKKWPVTWNELLEQDSCKVNSAIQIAITKFRICKTDYKHQLILPFSYIFLLSSSDSNDIFSWRSSFSFLSFSSVYVSYNR